MDGRSILLLRTLTPTNRLIFGQIHIRCIFANNQSILLIMKLRTQHFILLRFTMLIMVPKCYRISTLKYFKNSRNQECVSGNYVGSQRKGSKTLRFFFLTLFVTRYKFWLWIFSNFQIFQQRYSIAFRYHNWYYKPQ